VASVDETLRDIVNTWGDLIQKPEKVSNTRYILRVWEMLI